jgi:hypothetical protein
MKYKLVVPLKENYKQDGAELGQAQVSQLT